MKAADHKTIIIIPFYRGKEYINNCIASIRGDLPTIQILIIDNDPESNFSIASDPNVVVIKAQAGIGFARAVNLGLIYAYLTGFEKYIVLNQDTVFQPGSLKNLLGLFADHQSRVYIPVLMTYDFKDVARDFRQRSLGQKFEEKDLQSNQLLVVDEASAACLALGQSTLKKHGMLDTLFHMYGEDDDWFSRFQKAQGEICCVTSSRVAHYNQLDLSDNPKIEAWHERAKAIILSRNSRSPIWSILKSCLRTIYRGNGIRSIISVFGLLGQYRSVVRFDRDSVNRRAMSHLLNDIAP